MVVGIRRESTPQDSMAGAMASNGGGPHGEYAFSLGVFIVNIRTRGTLLGGNHSRCEDKSWDRSLVVQKHCFNVSTFPGLGGLEDIRGHVHEELYC